MFFKFYSYNLIISKSVAKKSDQQIIKRKNKDIAMTNTVKLNKNISVDFKILGFGEILVYTDTFSTVILNNKIFDNINLARKAILNKKEKILKEMKEREEAKRELDYLKKVEKEEVDFFSEEDLLFFEDLKNKNKGANNEIDN